MTDDAMEMLGAVILVLALLLGAGFLGSLAAKIMEGAMTLPL